MRIAVFFLALLLFLCATAIGQEVSTKTAPPVEEIVLRVQRNVEELQASLPDFLCDEQIVSQVFIKGKVKREVRVESTIRATRAKGADGPDLDVSREIRLVDGQPAQSQQLDLPFTSTGGFTKTLTLLFSPQSVRCVDFKLVGTEKLHGNTTLVVTATNKDDVKSLGGACESRTPGVTGKVWIDPETMQVVRVVGPRDRHTKGMKNVVMQGWPEDLLFSWSVDYSKILINGKPSWMPNTDTAEVVSTEKPRSMRWIAKYSNYHKFSVSSKVLPDMQVEQ